MVQHESYMNTTTTPSFILQSVSAEFSGSQQKPALASGGQCTGARNSMKSVASTTF